MDAGAGGDQLVEAVHQGAAAGHDDAVVGDVGHQLRGRALQHAVDGLQHPLHRLLKGLQHLGGGHGDGAGQAGEHAAALDLDAGLLLLGEDAADFHLHQLRGALADEQIVLAAHILDDGLVELVAGHLDGGGLHHAAEGDDGDVAGAAADIHHHVAVGLGDVDAGADGGGHRLLDEVHPAGTGLDAGVYHGALFYLGDAAGHADDDTGLEQLEAALHLMDELTEHTLGHVVIGDDALPQGTDGHNVAGGTAQHGLGLGAHLQQAAGVLIDGHHGGLVEHHALALYIYQNGGGTQVDTDVLCQSTHSLHLIILRVIWFTASHRR